MLAAATGAVLSIASASVAFAEGMTCVGHNCSATYVAVSPSGNAHSSQGVGLSATGYGYGGVLGLTAVGDAGGPVSIDASRTVGTAYGTTWQALSDVYTNTGVNPEETAYQVWAIATSPLPDANAAVEKTKRQAAHLQAMVEQTVNNPPPILEESSPPRGPYDWESAPVEGFAQPNGWSCVPASTRTLWHHRGMPGFWQLNAEMGTDEAFGTTLDTAAAIVRRHYSGPSQPKLDRVNDRIDLMTKAVTAITDYDQGFMIGVSTSHLPWWTKGDGTPRQGQHVLSGYAYVPLRGYAPGRAWVHVWDSRRSGPGSDGWGAGSHGILSDDLALAAVDAVGPLKSNIIW